MHYFFFFLIWMDKTKFFPITCLGAFKFRKERKRKQEKNVKDNVKLSFIFYYFSCLHVLGSIDQHKEIITIPNLALNRNPAAPQSL